MDPSEEAPSDYNGLGTGRNIPQSVADNDQSLESSQGAAVQAEDPQNISDSDGKSSSGVAETNRHSHENGDEQRMDHTESDMGASLRQSHEDHTQGDRKKNASLEPSRASPELQNGHHESEEHSSDRDPPDDGQDIAKETTPRAPKTAAELSSITIAKSTLEYIQAAKETKKRKALSSAVEKALAAIQDESITAAMVLETFRLATETTNTALTTSVLDCIGKLTTFSYFSADASGESASSTSLLDQAIEAICDCFQDEATPTEVQLQIIRSLLAAVLNDQLIVHGSGLLRAVRQVYNIFILSKSQANQQVAQGTLTQMVGTVFERISARLCIKEAKLRQVKQSSGKGSAQTSQVDLNEVHSPAITTDQDIDVDGHSGAGTRSDTPALNGSDVKLTLQNIEMASGFDDRTIADTAPTIVTAIRRSSRGLSAPTNGEVPQLAGDDANSSIDHSEIDEDEVYVRDAFLIFRSFCRLSHKELSPEQQQDIRSTSMRQKLISLALIRTTLNNHMAVFTSPVCTIKGGANAEPTSFGHAVNQYMRLSISRNAASSVRQVFETCAEIFWLMIKDMRVMLKQEIELFLKEIYLAILERKNSPDFQKLYVMKLLKRLSCDARAFVEIYLNYDCASNALDNMFQRIMEHLSRISGSPALVNPQAYHQYIDRYMLEADADLDWHDQGKMPPSLTTISLSAISTPESDVPNELLLKQQAVDCLVRTLRSLVNWYKAGLEARIPVAGESEPSTISKGIRLSTETIRNRASSQSSSTLEKDSQVSSAAIKDDPNQLERAKLRKNALDDAVRQFNFKPKRGIKALVSAGVIPDESPENIARFITSSESLDKAMVGEYLGEGEPHNVATMHAYVNLMDFTRKRFVDALRQFLQGFRLPGEAQKIDRFMLKFAERYITGNPNAFANADTAYVLAYSVIMLNTDQHSTKLKGKRMTVEDFIKNNRGINDNADLPDDYLASIYQEINQHEIVLDTERENAAAAGMMPTTAQGGIASRVGQAFLAGRRDLQQEAYVQASEEMSRKAEQRLRNIIKLQRRTNKDGTGRFIPATSFRHVGPMFDVTWMSFFSGLSGQLQTAQDIQVIKLCIEGMQLAIDIACHFDLYTPRTAFVTALASFTNLGNLHEMQAKNFEAVKALLETAALHGDQLNDSWRDVLMSISQLDRFQLITGGVDAGKVPDASKVRIQPSAGNTSRRNTTQSSMRARPASMTSQFDTEVVNASRSSEVVRAVDRIFVNTAELSGDSIVHFVRALSEVSWQEIQSSGQSEAPRTYSLQKLVEISYYNMTRVRFEWSNIWHVLGDHFNDVGCLTNTNVVFFALDSLRQLSMRFMELEELPGFKFQKDFLKPFEHIMSNSSAVAVKDMVLRCLIQMIQARGVNIRSGWKTMFGVFTVAARESYESIVNLAFDQVVLIYNTRLGVVISQAAFADLVVCLTEFSKNLRFQKKSLAAIETLRSTVSKMLKTPECSLSRRATTSINGSEASKEDSAARQGHQTQEEQFWFPILFAFHDILMTGEDLEVRSQASTYLFDILKDYGGDFPSSFWDILWRQLLYPIFMVLKSKSEMTKVLNHEDLSVWLSTTMIQALRNMITLFTHYFDSLEFMLDRFLDLLALCICQENDTIARIGSNCLQQLILQNVNRFTPQHWHKIVGSFVELFERTTAHRLFQAATTTSDDSQIGDDEHMHRTQSGMPAINGLGLTQNTSTDEAVEIATKDFPETSNHESPRRLSTITPNSGSASPVTPALEDYKPQNSLQQQPIVVTAARRKFFNRIITQCVLQLLMIETVNELFSNELVYNQIPSMQLLRLMTLLKASYSFAKRFNNDKELRMRLWKEGFMKQPPNLLKQESGAAACYIAILLRMYHDEGQERRRSRTETEAALVPLCADIIRSFSQLDESQPRNIEAWRPVVVEVMEGLYHFPSEDFDRQIETFYPIAISLLGKPVSHEIRTSLQNLLRRVGECRFGMQVKESVTASSSIAASPSIQSENYFEQSAVGKNS